MCAHVCTHVPACAWCQGTLPCLHNTRVHPWVPGDPQTGWGGRPSSDTAIPWGPCSDSDTRLGVTTSPIPAHPPSWPGAFCHPVPPQATLHPQAHPQPAVPSPASDAPAPWWSAMGKSPLPPQIPWVPPAPGMLWQEMPHSPAVGTQQSHHAWGRDTLLSLAGPCCGGAWLGPGVGTPLGYF